MFPVHFEQGLLLIYERVEIEIEIELMTDLFQIIDHHVYYIVRPTKNNNNSYKYKQIDDQDDEED